MKVFVSYRREDSRHITDRIYDWLVAAFGSTAIFKDVDSLPLGVDFRKAIETSLQESDVFLTVIGKKWTAVTTATGMSRLDADTDFVRLEMEVALSRNIPILPVLVDGASMPGPTDLPASIIQLAYRQATEVRADPDFKNDMGRLIRALKDYGVRPRIAYSSDLQIVSVRPTKDFELDIVLRNVGDEVAVIYQIDITLVADHGVCLPIIRPSALYSIPIDDLREGETGCAYVSHYVKAHDIDRFQIALHTTRNLSLRLVLHYNEGSRVEVTVRI